MKNNLRAFYNCFYLFSKRFTILFLVLFWLKILQKISNWFDSKLKHNLILKAQKIMKNLCAFAENLLERNSVETFVQVICSLTDEEIQMIIKG